MRTTIEISDKHRSILLALAAQKGLRGYSGIIKEALDYYIGRQNKTAENKRKILLSLCVSKRSVDPAIGAP